MWHIDALFWLSWIILPKVMLTVDLFTLYMFFYPFMSRVGRTRRVQIQHQQSKWLFEENFTGERPLASVWMLVLLLHTRLQPVARGLP